MCNRKLMLFYKKKENLTYSISSGRNSMMNGGNKIKVIIDIYFIS